MDDLELIAVVLHLFSALGHVPFVLKCAPSVEDHNDCCFNIMDGGGGVYDLSCAGE